MIYVKIFWSFFQIGLFSFGGGYAAMPLIQNQVVDINGWLSMQEFADVITISQMTPGPIAINSATFVGIRVAGVLGAIVATIGCILPSCIIVLLLSFLYYKYRGFSTVEGILNGLRPAVVAMIGSAGFSLLILAFYPEGYAFNQVGSIDFVAVAIFMIAFIILRKWKVNPINVMLGAGLIGLCIYPFF